MDHYHIYGMGAALVDTEVQVDDAMLERLGVEKGRMTLVDEGRQRELLAALEGQLVHSRRASGGSAANTIIAASHFGARTFYSCRVADDEDGHFYLADLRAAGVSVPSRDALPRGTTGKCLDLIPPTPGRTMTTNWGISETRSTPTRNTRALPRPHIPSLEGSAVT